MLPQARRPHRAVKFEHAKWKGRWSRRAVPVRPPGHHQHLKVRQQEDEGDEVGGARDDQVRSGWRRRGADPDLAGEPGGGPGTVVIIGPTRPPQRVVAGRRGR